MFIVHRSSFIVFPTRGQTCRFGGMWRIAFGRSRQTNEPVDPHKDRQVTPLLTRSPCVQNIHQTPQPLLREVERRQTIGVLSLGA